METAIKTKQNEIAAAVQECLAANEEQAYWGLANGRAGALLYLLYAHKHELITGFEQFEDAMQDLSCIGFRDIHFSYGAGKAGLNWFYQVMLNHGLLDEEDTNLLCFDDEYLESFALSALAAGNYDFLYGGIGAAASLLYRHGKAKEDFLKEVLLVIDGWVKQYDGAIPGFHLIENRPTPGSVNLGLAHGLPAILKFCLLCYTRDICREMSRDIALQLAAYLKAQAKADHTVCYFPSMAEQGVDGAKETSRLGWCYGDLGLGFVLYQAGIVLEDKTLETFALEVLTHTTGRRRNEQTLVHDAGLCHGSAGIAHMYNRLWQASQLEIFREACDYWMGETLRLANHTDGVAGYKKWDGAGKDWVSDFSLLEGAAGIGLVLISYLTGDCSWDYCLMLAD